ncbi:sucrase ferredoxin [Nocardioides currus]|uniref:Sucrase ferredoxin n=1 Tax=Nocardioides currus TaxID=2133958 RepID=A0A2R7YYF8_9ACTN|nr:sucrase ferredoxin [Nocardioides currus]PUA81403.1 sucrase ferredoxin [Nocardioides currus]
MTFRCSDGAAERDDPRLGTAPPQRDWLLVEHPGPWPVTAPFGADLPTSLLRELGHPELRTLFVRAHGRAGSRTALAGPRRWFRSHDGELRSGTWERADDLLVTLEPDPGTPHPDPVILVCTHGLHDVCCAVKGRPVAAALAERWPDTTLECSHLGGDRFAPNVMLLPDLACYAGMPPELAVPVVEEHLAGRSDPAWLRGVAGRHPAEQVALGSVLEQWGPAGVGDLSTRLVDQAGDFAAGTWTVEVSGAAPLPDRVRVVVSSERRTDAHRLTCRATRDTAALAWAVVSVSAAG